MMTSLPTGTPRLVIRDGRATVDVAPLVGEPGQFVVRCTFRSGLSYWLVQAFTDAAEANVVAAQVRAKGSINPLRWLLTH